MKKSFQTLVILLIFISNYVYGQNCPSGTDDPPGCLLECDTWSAMGEPFNPDTLSGLNCGTSGNTRWFKFKPRTNVVTLTMERFNCDVTTNVNIKMYDLLFVPISPCVTFTLNDFSSTLTTNSILSSQEYFVRVETNELVGCDFEIKLDRIQTSSISVFSPELIGDSTFVSGTAHLDFVQNVTAFDWSSSNPNVNILTGQGTAKITYSKPKNEAGNLCVIVSNDCYTEGQKCVELPTIQLDCESQWENFPGCDYPCKSFWGLGEPFVANTPICGTNSFSKWLKVTAVDSILNLSFDRFNCPTGTEYDIQIFDSFQNSVGNCVAIRSDNYTTTTFTFSNAEVGKEYSILIEGPTSFGFDFRMNISGTEVDFLPQIPEINLISSIQGIVDSALIDSIPDAERYFWEVSSGSVSIASGQGTTAIDLNGATNFGYEICVTPISTCEIGTKKCENIMAPPVPNLPPCCTSPGVPAGCQTSAGTSIGNSCTICSAAGIFSGNNGGYPPSTGFSCGISHNSAWVSAIADASGNFDAIMLSSNCNTGDGLQLILWDNAGNEIDCYSFGGSRNATVSQSGLLPGALYHLQIDGFSGDVCDYTIIITGSAAGQFPDPVTGFTATPDTILCPGAEVCFTIDDNPTAREYEWIPPPNMRIISGGGQTDLFMCCIVETVGGGVAKVTPSNFCFNGFPALLPTVATPIPPVIWPPVWVCNSDMPWDTIIKGNTYSFDQFGGAKIIIVTELGCDSVINLSLIPKLQIPAIIRTSVTAGSCFILEDSCYSVGNHVRVLENTLQKNGCDSTVNLLVSLDSSSIIITSDFTVNSNICIGEATTVTYTGNASTSAIYNWGFGNATVVSGSGAGPYVLIFPFDGNFKITLSVEENGNISPTTTNLINVIPDLLPLSLTCNSTIDEVTFSWTNDVNASNYIFNVMTGQSGIQNGNSYIISNLSPNEEVRLEVVAESRFGCAEISDFQTCKAQDCPTVAIMIDPVSAICLSGNTQPIPLTGQAGNNSGTFEWSGSGVNPSGQFDATQVGVGIHQISLKYTEGNCEYIVSISIEVNQTPTADFSVNSPICISDIVNVNYNGNATNFADFVWDFDGGMAVNTSGSTTYEVVYNSAGTRTISLFVEENGCTSTTVQQTVQVDEELTSPVISCSPTLNSISFSWNNVVGATNYQVNVSTGQTGILMGTNYFIDNLSPGETVSIEVTALGNSVCGNSFSSTSCVAQNCPSLMVEILPINNICLTGNTQPIQLSATAGNNSGTFAYSGNGVTFDGVFDPQFANIGTNIIAVEYTEGTCSYTASTSIEVYQTPTADFNINSDICQGETVMFDYTGSASNNANFNWNFGNGMIVTGSNSGPYVVSFNNAGMEIVSLIVEENGCYSNIQTNSIQIDPQLQPITISCQNSTLNQVSFVWNVDANVQNYQVQVRSGHAGNLQGNIYTVSGLTPGEQVTIQVVGNSGTSCPAVDATFTCQAINCSPVNLTIASVQDIICAGDSTEIQLTATNDSPTQIGTYVWSGNSVSTDGKFNTTGLSAGEYSVQVVYSEMGCSYQSTQIITIESTPEIAATVNQLIWRLGGLGSIDINVLNGTPPYTYVWNGAPNIRYDSLSPGEYCLGVSDLNGCSDFDCYTISEGTYYTKPVYVICSGDRQPIFVSPEVGATFSWSPALGLSCSDCASPIANPIRSTTYTVTATLPGGRSESQNVVLIVLPSFICNFSPLEIGDQIIEEIDFQNITNDDIEGLEKELTDLYSKNEVKVVPNPTGGIVNIMTPGAVESVEVFDFSGKKLISAKEKQINLSNLSKGIYFFKIKINDRVILKRVVLM